MEPLYELHVLNTKYYNGLKIFNLFNESDGSTQYGLIKFGLYTLTMEGIKFLALKLSNSTINTSKNYQIIFDIFGTDENNTEELNKYGLNPMSNDEATGYNLQDITKEGKPSYATLFNCDIRVVY